MKHRMRRNGSDGAPRLAWLAGALLSGATLMLGAATGAAQDGDADAKAAAAAVGAAGQASARTLATDADVAAKVPGFAGTNVPQAGRDEATLEAAARAALADPHDGGGAVGAFVIAGAAGRPDADVAAGDAEVLRADAVEAAPTAAAWQAGDLASGSVRDCARGVGGAQAGGRCGGVTWCVGADCGSVDAPANSGFVPAATHLNMVMEMGGSEFDRQSMRIFSGAWQSCPIRFLGGQNCCNDSGVFIEAGLLGCEAHEIELAEARAAGVTHYLGEFCAKRILGICRRRDRAWCVFTSQLGRILHEQARPQLGRTWDDCDGFSVQEIQRIDFDRVDLSEFTSTLLDGSEPPGVSLPDAGATRSLMRRRIGGYYETRE